MSNKSISRAVILVIAVVLAVILVIELAVVLYFGKQSSAVAPATVQPNSVPLSGSPEAGDSILLDSLNELDIAWQNTSTDEVLAYVAELEASEEGRRLLALQQLEAAQRAAEERRQRLEELRDLQEQLDAQNQASIIADGGIDLTTDEVLIIPGTPPPTTASPVLEPTPTPTPDIDDGYLGEFIARIVCTCASCYSESESNGVDVGETCVLVDPAYIEPGVSVTMSIGVSGELPVRDGNGIVSGRNIIVYTDNHTESEGGKTLYPKVYESEG